MAEQLTQGNAKLDPPPAAPKKKSKVGKVFKIGGFILLTVIFAFLLVNALLNIFMPHYYPTFAGNRLFSVVTDSMDPEIPAGYMIVSKKPGDESDITVGSVITFEVTDSKGNVLELLTHRVVNITTNPDTGETSYTTKGDNAGGQDSIHPDFSEVVGVYTGSKCAFFGYFFGFLQSTSGAIFLIACVFALAIAWILFAYINHRESRMLLNRRALIKSEEALSSVNLRYDNIREITAVMDVLEMVTVEPQSRAEEKAVTLRLNEFINAETIELPRTPETAAVLDSLPAPDTPLTLAAALRSGATLRQAEDGQTLILTGMSGGKSILLTPVQTPDGIILCQQGVRLRSNIAPNLEDVGAMSMPEYPEFFEGQPIRKNVEYPELPQPQDARLGPEMLSPHNAPRTSDSIPAGAALSAPTPVSGQAQIAGLSDNNDVRELAGGSPAALEPVRHPTQDREPPRRPGQSRRAAAASAVSDPAPHHDSYDPRLVELDNYNAKIAYAQYRELAAQLELRQVEQLQTLLDEVVPLSAEEQQRLRDIREAEKDKPKRKRKPRTPEQLAAQRERAARRLAEQEAFLAALSPADRELYLSEQKLSKSRAATIRRLKRMAADRKTLERHEGK